MAIFTLEPERPNLHGAFNRDRAPVLNVASGDTIRYRTLDAGWSAFDQAEDFEEPLKFPNRAKPEDEGHCLVGPVFVQGLKAGDVLEARIKHVRPGKWGWSAAGGFPSFVNEKLGLHEGEHVRWRWRIDADRGVATNRDGLTVPLRPFMGVMGMPADEPGYQPTTPPRFCGGNIDCKELIAGSTLYLPVAVDGGLFSLGDGHAVQGDGEVASPALECPMELVEVELHARPDLRLKNPRAITPAGHLTLGFHEDLNEAFVIALDGMLDWLGELKGFSRREALAFASLQVDLRITQVVNDVKGVHALLLPGA